MKTHLLTKKRALISSVAMLLVAIIALGTATFAWFTTNTSATADKLSVKTIKASELLLSKTSGDWKDQIHYDYQNQVLKPASSVDGTHWFTAIAKEKGKFDALDANATDISASLDGYVFKEQLNVMNAGKATVNNVKISFSLTETEAVAGKKYVRLALVPTDNRGADAAVTKANFQDPKYMFASGADTADAFADATKTTETITATSGAAGEVEVGTLAADEARYFNLYVWFEGQDTDCSDKNAGNIMPEIRFTVSGENAENTGA